MTLPLVGPIVRATTTSEAIIWAEFAYPCKVTVTAYPLHTPSSGAIHTTVSTLRAGGHFYAVARLNGLTPATWYTYELHTLPEATSTIPSNAQLRQCFRTFAASNIEQKSSLRIAYGSCRKLDHPEKDTLTAFGSWLEEHFEQRDDLWPHVLLMIGDQIYADQPPPDLASQVNPVASRFEEFTTLYKHAWTYDQGIRQVLAMLPTYMIFDDHEITNNWNAAPNWQQQALRNGQEQTIVDGLVAYWLYQGWGNLPSNATTPHPLLALTQAAQESGEDALEALRYSIRTTLSETTHIPWHYSIATSPSIFVTNTRTERTSGLAANDERIYAPTSILGDEQMQDFQSWLDDNPDAVTLLVSSVPLLLPPLIGLVEYYAGQRLWSAQRGIRGCLGRWLAQLQIKVAEKASFDHWPLYAASWRALLTMLNQRQGISLILSGDVHFSYAVSAETSAEQMSLLQFVCTPFQNALSSSDRRKIVWQSFFQGTSYGDLRTRLLPLQPKHKTAEIKRNHLYQDSLALLTLQTEMPTKYQISHTYFGLIDDRLKEVAHVTLPALSQPQKRNQSSGHKVDESVRTV
ncbi:alkaline phosphatase D family protein [Ktedonospora formicarum]|uniref:Metallophosphatase n=1 Tax=Ktedonospora formicarum TaxID=2778364 RepID=A0A8J3MNN8_9CHLR|nr:alkaline phosphatase D family protein [Ktedonospora formicarum]GHO42972.1 metallophosphatase [Ktedonospora formicarum]